MFKKVISINLCFIFLFMGCNKATINSDEQVLSSQISSANDDSPWDIPASEEEIDLLQSDSTVPEHETEAQYFPITDTATKAIGNARFDFWITIPSDWKAFARSENGDGYFIECGNKNIDIRVYGQNDVLPEEFYINSDDGGIVSEFKFDSGISGWSISKENSSIKFLYNTNERYVVFYINYEDDLEWFEENKEEIFLTAKTLQDGTRTE